MSEGFDPLGRAVRVDAIQGSNAVFIVDSGVPATDGAFFWNLKVVASRQVLRNLWNDHVGLVDADFIADAQFELL